MLIGLLAAIVDLILVSSRYFDLNSVFIVSTNSPNLLVKELGCFEEFGDEKRVQKFVRRTWVRGRASHLQCTRNWLQPTKAWCGAPPVHQKYASIN